MARYPFVKITLRPARVSIAGHRVHHGLVGLVLLLHDWRDWRVWVLDFLRGGDR